jgi:deoxyribodipyrimidine photo-lyase
MTTRPYALSLFVFRRDLRLDDNTALRHALEQSERVLLCFVLDPRQVEPHPYRSIPALQYMIESLLELREEIRQQQGELVWLLGEQEQAVARLLEHTGAQAVFVNRDYTPFAQRRDARLQAYCEHAGAAFHAFDDCLLHAPGTVVKDDGSAYRVYSQFARVARKQPVPEPAQVRSRGRLAAMPVPFAQGDEYVDRLLAGRRAGQAVAGGRAAALGQLRRIDKLSNYAEDRNFPARCATTGLSACNKFGVLSVREVYHAIASRLGAEHTLIAELYWRDFFTHIAYFFPEVFGESFQVKARGVRWSHNEERFAAWCEGRTGFPLVDAGMRELNATGLMHNRVRMVTASFLTKDLHIDWRWGERYFAQRLIDYDPAVNNGNWQWSASTGADAQPYFRVFNPWSQQKRFDPECEYIRAWVDELRSSSAEEIHGLEHEPLFRPRDYPAPMVDHRLEAIEAQARFRVVPS